jgi:hypothetical protein
MIPSDAGPAAQSAQLLVYGRWADRKQRMASHLTKRRPIASLTGVTSTIALAVLALLGEATIPARDCQAPPGPESIMRCPGRIAASLGSPAHCSPSTEALLAPRNTTWLGEWASVTLSPLHGSHCQLLQGQPPGRLPGIPNPVPILPRPPLRILFCSWVV